MKSEKEKMLSGELYQAFGEELSGERLKARILVHEYNTLHPENSRRHMELLNELLGETGENFYANFNLVMIDSMNKRVNTYCYS
jgi:maltose O-acetyltransferase